MKNKFLKFLTIAIFGIALMPRTYALETTYVNSVGVEMTNEQYKSMITRYDEKYVETMSQDEFDFEINHEIMSSSKEVIYVEETTLYNLAGNPISTIERTITEEEFKNYIPVKKTNIQKYSTRGAGDTVYYSTNAKQLSLVVNHYIAPTGQNFIYSSIVVNCYWLTTPAVRSYDVIATRWTASNSYTFTRTSSTGRQSYYKNNTAYHIDYSNGGNNSKIFSDGVGISMNIVDDLTSGLNASLRVDGKSIGSGRLTAYGTYQHAKQNVTLAQSKSYILASTGLGGVLYYGNSTIRGYYDGMQGVSAYNLK